MFITLGNLEASKYKTWDSNVLLVVNMVIVKSCIASDTRLRRLV